MEKYENIIKIEEVRRLIEEKEYRQAVIIIDNMDITNIKATTDLSAIADVYTKNQRYNEAREVLNKLYERSYSRRVVFQLLEVSIKSQNLALANRYYREYIEIAPKDPTRFIFQYLIRKLKKKPIIEQIEPLKTLKRYEYIEEWVYELATLYHKAGMIQECINECSDIIIWFGTGEYVERAKLLKGHYEGEIDLFALLREKEEQKLEEKRPQVKPGDKKLEDTAKIDSLEEIFKDKNIDFKDIFGEFLNDESIKGQIVATLTEIDKNPPTYLNLIISSKSSNKDEDNTSFVKAILTVLYKMGYISNYRVGIIDGQALDKIDIRCKKDDIRNCALIINNPQVLSEDTIDKIEELIIDDTQDTFIILQGTEDEIDQLLGLYPQLSLYFQFKIIL